MRKVFIKWAVRKSNISEHGEGSSGNLLVSTLALRGLRSNIIRFASCVMSQGMKQLYGKLCRSIVPDQLAEVLTIQKMSAGKKGVAAVLQCGNRRYVMPNISLISPLCFPHLLQVT
jgi:hypothetical protein